MPDRDLEELLAAFARWASGERAREASSARRRERWLRQQQTESATLAGLLVDLAEQRALLRVVAGGRPAGGRLVGVGSDFCVLEEPGGGYTLIPTQHLQIVSPHGGDGQGASHSARTGPEGGPATGDRKPVLDMRFCDALTVLAADLTPVRIWLVAGEFADGNLVATGTDVVTLAAERGRRGTEGVSATRYIPFHAISGCSPL